jgi:hypothetical protein
MLAHRAHELPGVPQRQGEDGVLPLLEQIPVARYPDLSVTVIIWMRDIERCVRHGPVSRKALHVLRVRYLEGPEPQALGFKDG